MYIKFMHVSIIGTDILSKTENRNNSRKRSLRPLRRGKWERQLTRGQKLLPARTAESRNSPKWQKKSPTGMVNPMLKQKCILHFVFLTYSILFKWQATIPYTKENLTMNIFPIQYVFLLQKNCFLPHGVILASTTTLIPFLVPLVSSSSTFPSPFLSLAKADSFLSYCYFLFYTASQHIWCFYELDNHSSVNSKLLHQDLFLGPLGPRFFTFCHMGVLTVFAFIFSVLGSFRPFKPLLLLFEICFQLFAPMGY